MASGSFGARTGLGCWRLDLHKNRSHLNPVKSHFVGFTVDTSSGVGLLVFYLVFPAARIGFGVSWTSLLCDLAESLPEARMKHRVFGSAGISGG